MFLITSILLINVLYLFCKISREEHYREREMECNIIEKRRKKEQEKRE